MSDHVHIPASPGPRVAGNPTLLSVRDLRTEYISRGRVVTAVRDVNFDVRRLERLGIVGESGSGKSTLARSLLGLIEPPGRISGGSLDFDGRSLGTLSNREWEEVRGNEISMVCQDPMTGFDPLRTVGSQIVEAIRIHRMVTKSAARQEAAALLREVECRNPLKRMDDYPHQFSGGMRQRAMIAMALANGPKLLIADEPTTALDVTTQAAILKLLRRLSDDHGMAVILISHDFGVIAQLCDTVQVMYAGKIVERGPAMEVLTSPRHRYTEALLQSIIPREMNGNAPIFIPGYPPNLSSLPQGCCFEPRCRTGNGRTECMTMEPSSSSSPSPYGSVTVKCHFPASAAVEVRPSSSLGGGK